MKRVAVIAAAVSLAGCASNWQLQVMPRDSGTIYHGVWQTGGTGESTMTITLPDRTYSGPVVRTSSNHTYGFYESFGWRGFGPGFGTVDFYGGTVRMKALLTSPDGHGLRCDFSGDNYRMGGICADDSRHVYDVIATSS